MNPFREGTKNLFFITYDQIYLIMSTAGIIKITSMSL